MVKNYLALFKEEIFVKTVLSASGSLRIKVRKSNKFLLKTQINKES